MVWRGVPLARLGAAAWPTRARLLDRLAADCAAAADRHRAILEARRVWLAFETADPPEVIAARLAVWGVVHPSATAEASREYQRLKMRRLRATWRRDQTVFLDSADFEAAEDACPPAPVDPDPWGGRRDLARTVTALHLREQMDRWPVPEKETTP